AEARDGQCRGCGMRVLPHILQELHSESNEDLYRCESCGLILYSLEPMTAPNPRADSGNSASPSSSSWWSADRHRLQPAPDSSHTLPPNREQRPPRVRQTSMEVRVGTRDLQPMELSSAIRAVKSSSSSKNTSGARRTTSPNIMASSPRWITLNRTACGQYASKATPSSS